MENFVIPYAGKTAVFVGDSITFGLGLQETEKRYWQILQECLKFEKVTACALSGSCVSIKNILGAERDTLTMRMAEIPGADMIFLLMGINDWNFNTPIGKPGDTKDISYYGGWNIALSYLKETYPRAKIVLMTPAPHCRPERNEIGLTAADYIAPLWVLAEKYDVTILDTNTLLKGEFTKENQEKYLPDGIHPNENGQTLMAQKIRQWLEENADRLL